MKKIIEVTSTVCYIDRIEVDIKKESAAKFENISDDIIYNYQDGLLDINSGEDVLDILKSELKNDVNSVTYLKDAKPNVYIEIDSYAL